MSRVARSGKAAPSQSARPTSTAHRDGTVFRSLVWVALLGVFLFCLASLVSYSPFDPPTHLIWPANDPVKNWCGPAGAALAYHTIKLLGVGVWVLIAGFAAYLGAMALGKPVGHFPVRLIGVLMIAAAVAGVQAILFPSWTSMPGLAGGLVGSVGGEELVARFSQLGSLVWIVLIFMVGAVVAFDHLVLTVPAAMMRVGSPHLKRAGAAAGTGTVVVAGSAARATGGVFAALFTALKRSPSPAGPAIRLTDLEDEDGPQTLAPTNSKRKRSIKPAPPTAPTPTEPSADDDAEADTEPDAPPPAAAASTAKSRSKPAAPPPVIEADDEIEPDDEESDDRDELDDDDRGGASDSKTPKIDEAALREKIGKLPVRFAATTRKVATEDDLRDLQGVEEVEGYRFPGLDLLENPEEDFSQRLEDLVRDQAQALEAALKQYRIEGGVVGIESGPVITLYEVRLAPGTKVAALQAVSSDIARALKAINIRIVPNMVGRDTVGVEVPNPTKEKVRLKELMSRSESSSKMRLPMFLGKDASGEPLIADLCSMPHMLIAGTTGSGKSVAINTIIMGFLYTKKPNELKLVLVDPKMVEMSQFKDIPHLMCPVVTEMSKAAAILEWATKKMDERYELLAEAGCRDIATYNELPWEELRDRMNPQSPEEEARIPRKLPYMVFIIDELADLMMTAKEVESSIIRIAQKARAVGIHLILATQRPQANVVTGLIKSNMPARIAFKVASGMDSRIVLDQKGGELLLGQGDMLYLSPRTSKLMRAQGTLVDDSEIRRVVKFMRDVARPTFERQLLQIRSGELNPEESSALESENNSSASLRAAQEDPLFDRAVEIVLETKRGSVSLLQRRLAIGYTRASRLIDLMGIAGIISDHKGSVARDVMITPDDWEAMKRLHAEELAKIEASGGSVAPPGQTELFTPTPGQDNPGSAIMDAQAALARDDQTNANDEPSEPRPAAAPASPTIPPRRRSEPAPSGPASEWANDEAPF